MTIGTSRKTVTFNGPFALSGVDEILPGGACIVETDEEPLASHLGPRLPAAIQSTRHWNATGRGATESMLVPSRINIAS